ncbi:IS5 family transposase [Streptomyces carpinensis]|uniref:IS5 family transposase n=1 Tax=Streptomyces carpinensis TaxID=66369 RepID=A0ABV1WF83_9ACTN|nr:IS5 family transposase [Streptomyces carpinensis]
MRTGVPWRDLPPEYGPWQTVYRLFRRWQRQGVWARLLTLLQARADDAGLITWEVNVDSTICRAHQHAAGARRDGAGQKEAPGGVAIEPDDHGLGRSRGGFTTKLHLACEQGQRPLSLFVTAGHRHDSLQFQPVLEAIRVPRTGPGPAAIPPGQGPGGQAYGSRANRAVTPPDQAAGHRIRPPRRSSSVVVEPTVRSRTRHHPRHHQAGRPRGPRAPCRRPDLCLAAPSPSSCCTAVQEVPVDR